jgi:ethanolamine utilization protein EutA
MTNNTVPNLKQSVIIAVSEFFRDRFGWEGETLAASFEQAYEERLQPHMKTDTPEVAGIRQLIVQFRPALSSVLQPCEEFDQLLTLIMWMFKVPWEGAHRRSQRPSPRRDGPILPGSDQSLDISFICAVCGEEVDVPYEEKTRILSSEGEELLPTHCGQDVRIKISRREKETAAEEITEDAPPEPVEMLMGHVPAENVEYIKVLSVGVDIGSSTSHLMFSRLTLKRETSLFNPTNRFNLVNREILYKSSIIFTPLIDRYTIDIDAVVRFCREEYQKAGISPDMVETGAVVVTGETAKKRNAAEIVNRISSESGRFVSATAGPNLESLLGALGSGIVDYSLRTQKTILHVDLGGGTSNMAVVSNGQVISTSCINVGGRLLGIDEDLKMWRIDGPTQFVMRELGMAYRLGDTITEEDARTIARVYAETLLEVMQGPSESTIARELMMTDDLELTVPIDAYSFSGGVAEMFYGSDGRYDDIGTMLAKEIRDLIEDMGLTVVEPENKIRATVIGAGAFSLSVSGSTTFFDKGIELPLSNIPVLPVNLGMEEFTVERVVEEVQRSFKTFDMVEGEDVVGLYFRELIYSKVYTGDQWLAPFAKAIEKALPSSVTKKRPIILLFGYDIAKRLGLALRDETSIQGGVLCLDELQLEAGDWIDIGEPLRDTGAFPVTVKSLVFNKNREYS